MARNIACLLFGHRWYYLLSEVGYVPLYGWPLGTRCQRCGVAHPSPLPPPPRPGAACRGGGAELVDQIHQIALAWEPDACLLGNMTAEQLARAADLLAQRHPAPVPVSERLPEPEDCDAKGRCWLLTVEDEYPQWRLHSIEGALPGGTMIWVPVDSSPGVMVDCFYTSHWLPAHAIPIPRSEND
jgi:hypothetical protein